MNYFLSTNKSEELVTLREFISPQKRPSQVGTKITVVRDIVSVIAMTGSLKDPDRFPAYETIVNSPEYVGPGRSIYKIFSTIRQKFFINKIASLKLALIFFLSR
jgi:hypothetical protein